ncbi:hypothetical protein G7046_g8641 [Stylonectria norvegica]|nr:hypothetical protein G7046_g8641 [Stylonectria norvegica]
MRGFVLPVALLAVGALAQNSTCAKGLYVIVARGTGEVKGTGVTGVLADDIAAKVPGSRIEALDYPATFTDPDYPESEKDGVEALQGLITSYTKTCPKSKIAFLGYSQGGQLATDAFCGGSGDGFSTNAALPTQLVDDSVVAIVLFGDPSHVANLTYDRGTSIKDGIFARKNVSLCEDYTDILRSYCDVGDVYCDAGSNKTVHGLYVARYGDEAVDFVVKRYEDDAKSSSSASGTATATTAAPTGSPTATVTASGTASGVPTGSTVPANSAAGLVPGLAAALIAPLVLLGVELLK